MLLQTATDSFKIFKCLHRFILFYASQIFCNISWQTWGFGMLACVGECQFDPGGNKWRVWRGRELSMKISANSVDLTAYKLNFQPLNCAFFSSTMLPLKHCCSKMVGQNIELLYSTLCLPTGDALEPKPNMSLIWQSLGTKNEPLHDQARQEPRCAYPACSSYPVPCPLCPQWGLAFFNLTRSIHVRRVHVLSSTDSSCCA